ncbi:SusC/RagA family TonB-linked outer membrane protein [Christiangramia marina]|uniref:SusC/RagA family TonB-linked outer membrane protein n=1 Tax=Christiangramia marina TaxID=409436 RepID=UPI003AA9339A
MKNNYKRGMVVIMFLLAMAVLTILAIGELQAATPYHSVLYQQNVNGKVTGLDGNPLLGVTVRVAGKNYGTTTNLDGDYAIIANSGDMLVFSFVGYKPQEILIDEQSEVNVSLEEDVDALKEVTINAGYYNTTRRESTGNISRVTASEIENQPVVSPLQALQGRMAGVEITSGGFTPGTATRIRIRGVNSLREEGNYPLYIIDGVPVNSIPVETTSVLPSPGIDPLSNLDINNIESIEILKDADATAIYGSRGANGVVLITTKKGVTTGTGLQARFYYGAAVVPTKLDLLNSSEYLRVRRRAFANDSIEPTMQNAPELTVWNQEKYTDWQDFLYGGTAETTNASLNFSGGDQQTFFRLGGSFFTQGTIYPADYDYKKITGNLNLNHRSKNEKFQVNLAVNYGVDLNEFAGSLGFDVSTILLPPNAPNVFNDVGGLNWEEWEVGGFTNPVAGYFNTANKHTQNLVSNIGLSYRILPGLQLKTSLGYTNYTSEELRKQPSRSYNPTQSISNKSNHLRSERASWIIEPQLNYEMTLGKLNLESLFGTTLQENTALQERFLADGYASEALIGNIGAAESIRNPARSNTQYRYAAIFSRVGINWDRTYYLNLTGRRDGSSRFGPNNRFANFGAIGTAWIFSEEEFMETTFPFISFGKLRASYGTTGNDQIGDYGYLDTYEATRGPGGLYPTSLANPDFSWEINKKFEVGVELGFLKDQHRLSLSYYRNRSSNQLVGYPLPATTGFTLVQANLPATVENYGWELVLNTEIFNKEQFNWNASLNLSLPKNRLVSYPNIDQSTYANTYRVGEPLNISLVYDYTGRDPNTGLYTVRDVNEDGRYDYQDRIIAKDLNRELFGGISNTINHKNFSLQFLWQFVKQEGIIPNITAGGRYNTMSYLLSSLDEQSIFQPPSTLFPAREAEGYALQSTFPYQIASFWRLKNLSLAYKIPEDLINSIGMQNGRVFLHGQNLLTITPFKGLDAENPYSLAIGNLKSVTAGIEVNF